MEDRNTTEKYRDFAADYDAGMDRDQLCSKYVIPRDRFESFLKYLIRTGILIQNPPPPRPPEQEATPTLLATCEAATVGQKVWDLGRRIASEHPRAILCYVITLLITIILILIGSPSLTGALWKHRTEKKVLTSNDSKLYLNNSNPAMVYVEIPANGDSFKYEVTRGWRNLPLDEPDNSIIRIEDQTKLKSKDLSVA